MLRIPSKNENERGRHFTFRIHKRTFWLGLSSGIALGALGIIGFASHDFSDQRALYHRLRQAQDSVSQLLSDVRHFGTKAHASWQADPQRIVLDVQAEHMKTIVDKRNAALERGLLFASSDDYVPAKIGTTERVLKAKIRLKGDLMDHLSHPDRWSFRVQIGGDQALNGMKRFSLQPPATRNYLNEWVLHRMVKDEGLIGLRYDFVSLTLNGNDLGIYALEEHFSKQLIESNARREGPILRFEEGTFWGAQHLDERDPYFTASISAFGMKSVLEDPATEGHFALAASHLQGVREGTQPIGSAFDLEQMAHYLAICDLLGAHHGLSYNNMRFYYNPVSGLLEPVAYDAIAGVRIGSTVESRANLEGIQGYSFLRAFFEDPEFCGHYHRALARVCEDSFLARFFEKWGPEIERHSMTIQSQYPQIRFDGTVFEQNREFIRRFLSPGSDGSVYAHERGTEFREIDVVSLRPRSSSVTGVLGGSGVFYPYRDPAILTPYRPGRPAPVRTMALPSGWDSGDSVAAIRIGPTGLTETADVEARPYPVYGNFATLPRESTSRSFPFIQRRTESGVEELVLPAGDFEIDRDLVIAAHERLVITEGCRIDLLAGAKIISFSAITATGSIDRPIRIRSSDGRGQGLCVILAEARSRLHHVHFEGLTYPRAGLWSVTGAATFYESDVELTDCSFDSNQCEDALNIIRSEFTIDRCRFAGAASDSLDCDFSQGQISDTIFVGSGNDAIDTSGSAIRIEHVVIRGAGDKGVSAGEGSDLLALDLRIERVEIAVASKDDSRIRLTDLFIADARLDFAVYNKKPEYGPGRVEANFSAMQASAAPTFLLERGSFLLVENERMAPNEENVADDLYGVKYGRRTQ